MTDLMKQTLGERVERLHKFINTLHAPPVVICIEVVLVIKAAFAVYPEQMGAAMARWISATARSECAICPECSGYMPHEMHICEKCIQAAGQEEF
jgi:hypothetical protein